MSYQALYRKWRPSTFDEIVGQDAVVTTLKNQVSSDRIGHAYLFCGTRGTGKTSAAKIMARAVNCPHAAEHGGSPCNSCEVCEAIQSGRAMNVFEIDAASNNGVDNIRDIREQVEYPPVIGRFKVYIIDEVHMLSTGAFNALLKTLEEPPAYVIFILATTDPQKIPQTILSRCQRYDFRRMSRRTAASHLREIAALEGMSIEDKALSYIAEAADGSMRDALSLLDQCAAYHYQETLTYDNVLEILGAADTGVFSRMYGNIVRGEIEEVLTAVNDIAASGSDISQLINDFIWYLRTVLLAGSSASADILDISEDRLTMARADAALAGRQELIRIMSALAELGNRCRFSTQKRVLLEVELIRLCTSHAADMQPAGAGAYEQVPAARPAAEAAGSYGQNPAGSSMAYDARGSEPPASEGGTPEAAANPRAGSIRQRLEAEMARKRGLQEPMSAKITVEIADSAPGSYGTNRAEARDGGYPQPVDDTAAAVPQEDQHAIPEAQAAESKDAPEQRGTETQVSSDRPEPAASMPESGDRLIDVLRMNWKDMISELAPSNRTLFAGVVLKQEKNSIVLLFKNKINYTLAARNTEENGVLRLRELAAQRLGRPVSFMARIAKPGEIEATDNRMTDEEIARIHFPVEFEE